MKRDILPSVGMPAPVALAHVQRSAWRRHLTALALVLASLIAAYWRTGAHIVEIWSRSSTFTHGFVVPLISAWLIFRARDSLREVTPAASPAWLVAVAGCGFLWLCGEVGMVNAASQLAFVAMLVCAVPAVLGTAVARRLMFPLAFLFFAVPIGEFMLPTLMQWTADFTVSALRASGVPVYREGQELIIPSGRWSVVEACSGIRYLIASLMVGTLYAYLCFASLRRRLLFIAVSLLIPIVANWLRAYMIVMMGHLSNNTLAVGVDHLIYGWLFFGVVMLLMFWAASHWRDDMHAFGEAASPAPVAATVSPWSNFAVGLLVVACAAVWPLAFRAIDARMAAPSGVTLDPVEATGGWRARAGPLTSWTPEIQSPSALLRETFTKDGRQVGLDVAYFRNQSRERKLVSSTNVLGASGVQPGMPWAIVAEHRRPVLLDGRRFDAREVSLAGPNERRLVALHWYWIGERMTANDVVAKLYTFLSRLAGRDEGAIVVVYAEQGAEARRALDDFLRENGAALQAMLRRASGELTQ